MFALAAINDASHQCSNMCHPQPASDTQSRHKRPPGSSRGPGRALRGASGWGSHPARTGSCLGRRPQSPALPCTAARSRSGTLAATSSPRQLRPVTTHRQNCLAFAQSRLLLDKKNALHAQECLATCGCHVNAGVSQHGLMADIL